MNQGKDDKFKEVNEAYEVNDEADICRYYLMINLKKIMIVLDHMTKIDHDKHKTLINNNHIKLINIGRIC